MFRRHHGPVAAAVKSSPLFFRRHCSGVAVIGLSPLRSVVANFPSLLLPCGRRSSAILVILLSSLLYRRRRSTVAAGV